MRQIIEQIRITNRLLAKNNLFTLFGTIFALLAVAIALLAITISIINFRGEVGTIGEHPMSILKKYSPSLSQPIGLSKGVTTSYLRTNPPLSDLAFKIIECESEWNPNAIGKAGEIGLAQFKIGTWHWLSKKAGVNLDINSLRDQIWLLQWALDNGFESHWTCFNLVN